MRDGKFPVQQQRAFASLKLHRHRHLGRVIAHRDAGQHLPVVARRLDLGGGERDLGKMRGIEQRLGQHMFARAGNTGIRDRRLKIRTLRTAQRRIVDHDGADRESKHERRLRRICGQLKLTAQLAHREHMIVPDARHRAFLVDEDQHLALGAVDLPGGARAGRRQRRAGRQARTRPRCGAAGQQCQQAQQGQRCA